MRGRGTQRSLRQTECPLLEYQAVGISAGGDRAPNGDVPHCRYPHSGNNPDLMPPESSGKTHPCQDRLATPGLVLLDAISAQVTSATVKPSLEFRRYFRPKSLLRRPKVRQVIGDKMKNVPLLALAHNFGLLIRRAYDGPKSVFWRTYHALNRHHLLRIVPDGRIM